jgi:GNAT superfamily N-acetyltransferase
MTPLSLRACILLKDLTNLRTQYLDSCPEPQELYLELKVHGSRAFVIEAEGEQAGYLLIGLDGVLLEYFVVPAYIRNAEAWFREILQRCSIQKALCKSFDHTLLACCLDRQISVRVEGILCREWVDRPHPKREDLLAVRTAGPEDVQQIIAINEEVFDHPDQVRDYVQNERVLMFEDASALIGFGLFSRVIPGRPEFDIGMLVVPAFRRLGYGSAIIRYMADFCRKQGWRPICGCDATNAGSLRCLQNAGFIARHRLLEFTFP